MDGVADTMEQIGGTGSTQRQQSQKRPQSRQACHGACLLKPPPWHAKQSQEHSHHPKHTSIAHPSMEDRQEHSHHLKQLAKTEHRQEHNHLKQSRQTGVSPLVRRLHHQGVCMA